MADRPRSFQPINFFVGWTEIRTVARDTQCERNGDFLHTDQAAPQDMAITVLQVRSQSYLETKVLFVYNVSANSGSETLFTARQYLALRL
jgi:hypothetical protein